MKQIVKTISAADSSIAIGQLNILTSEMNNDGYKLDFFNWVSDDNKNMKRTVLAAVFSEIEPKSK